MTQSDVTIIIPAYCTSVESLEWLRDSVKSAAMQGCEVIVWDDGSPMDVFAALADMGPSVRVYLGEHRGVSYARNKAIELVSTPLILPLDGDDKLVDGAVEKMLEYYDGSTPVYPDVAKFGDVTDPHYILLDFDCSHVYRYVGFTSVNVLHQKVQWEKIGGYDEDIDFYEDGEYNARLFLSYCGLRCPFPLVNYRQHSHQRTNTYKSKANAYAKSLIKKIGGYKMACKGCGQRRTPNITPGLIKTANTATAAQLPETQGGMVLVQYIGGLGRGRHYVNGIVSGTPYKVKNAEYFYVKPEDAREETDSNSRSTFIRVHQTATAPQPAQPVVRQAPEVVKPKKVQQIKKEEEFTPEDFGARFAVKADKTLDVARVARPSRELPDIRSMSIKQVDELDLSLDDYQRLLSDEAEGLNRPKILKILRSHIDASAEKEEKED